MIISKDYVRGVLPPLDAELNKYTAGSVMIFAGSYGMAGAAVLSAKAALRSGAGLCRLVIPDSIYSVCAASVWEAVYSPVAHKCCAFDEAQPFISKCSAIAFGPGMGQSAEVYASLEKLLTQNTIPLVIDADGINVLSQHIDVLKEKTCPVVLTPHEGEMARLTGRSAEYIRNNRRQVAEEFSCKYGVTLLLKGKDTLIANGTRLAVNPTGNPGMATAGSGDVLTGIISSFISGTGSPFDAACAGAFIHGLSGDIAAGDFGERSLTASDIIEYLPKAFKEC